MERSWWRGRSQVSNCCSHPSTVVVFSLTANWVFPSCTTLSLSLSLFPPSLSFLLPLSPSLPHSPPPLPLIELAEKVITALYRLYRLSSPVGRLPSLPPPPLLTPSLKDTLRRCWQLFTPNLWPAASLFLSYSTYITHSFFKLILRLLIFLLKQHQEKTRLFTDF